MNGTVARLERAIGNNPRCRGGLLAKQRAFALERGPSGGPEALALLFADDSFLGYWYGHVQSLPAGGFAASPNDAGLRPDGFAAGPDDAGLRPDGFAAGPNDTGLRPGGRFVALLAWSKCLVNAGTVPLLFRRFHYWMRVRLQYEPCSVQAEDDAYAEATGFQSAVSSLETMIARFDLARRWPDEDGPFASSPSEMRILDIYGLEDHRDANGAYPPVPMPTPLRLVTGPP